MYIVIFASIPVVRTYCQGHILPKKVRKMKSLAEWSYTTSTTVEDKNEEWRITLSFTDNVSLFEELLSKNVLNTCKYKMEYICIFKHN